MGLRVDGRDAEHAAHPVGADADGGDDRRGPHAAVPPALEVGCIEEQVGRLDAAQPARGELADLGVQRFAHRADPVPREPLHAHLAGDPLHLPRRHAVRPRLRYGRRDGAVGTGAALGYALGEVGAGPQLGYAKRDVAHGGGEAALAVAVSGVRPVLAEHVGPRAHHLVHHGFQERARQLPHVEEPVAVGWELL